MPSDAQIIELSVDREADAHLVESPLPDLGHLSATGVRILVAGLDLFAARGYHATSIRDIASAAGLQSASLYTHFASKEAILGEIVNTGYTVHNRLLMAAVVGSGPDPKDQLRKLIEAHVAAHCRWAKLAAVATREIANLSEQAAAPAYALRDSSLALLMEIIERGLRQGVFVIQDLDITLSAIGSLGTAVINWYPAKAEQYTPEQVGATYADLTLRMVGAAL